MTLNLTRPEHLRQAVDEIARTSPDAALKQLMRSDPVLGAFIAERQDCLIRAMEHSSISTSAMAAIATEQLRGSLVAAEMQRLGFEADVLDADVADHVAWSEALSRSEPAYGVID